MSVHNLPVGIQDSKDRIKAYMTVFGGFIYMMVSILLSLISVFFLFEKFLGCQYVVGTIAPYLGSFFNVDSESTALILPVIFITNIFVMPFGA